jgi:small subunit ribosomal protein S6
MQNNYETVFILTPVLSDEQAKEAVSKYKKLLVDAGAKILNEEHWGLKKLAYPIQKKSTGFYHLFQFTASGETISKLEVEYKRDERILRFLTLKLDKHAIEYAEKRKNKAKQTKKEAANA